MNMFKKSKLQSVLIFFKVCQSVPSFVFSVFFKPSSNVLNGYFHASLNLAAVSIV